jgi:CBS domain-containing protein
MMVGAESVGPDMPLAEARAFFTPRKKLLLVTEGERFLGTLTPADLPETGEGPIGPHVNPDPPRVTTDDPVAAAMALVEGDGMTRIPVVDDGRLRGMVCFNRSHEAFCVYPS